LHPTADELIGWNVFCCAALWSLMADFVVKVGDYLSAIPAVTF